MSLKSLLRSLTRLSPLRWMIQLSRRLLTMVEKPRQNPRVTHETLPTVSGFLILAGMLLFLTVKLLPSDLLFRGAYYLWDKTKDLFLVYCLLLLCPSIRRFLLVVFTYLIIRVLWQIFTIITKEDINDNRWVDGTWLILVSYMTYLCIREILNRQEK